MMATGTVALQLQGKSATCRWLKACDRDMTRNDILRHFEEQQRRKILLLCDDHEQQDFSLRSK